MKILMINNFHYRKGGSEAVYFNTAEELASRGHEVHFFSFKRKENIPCHDEIFFPVFPYTGNIFVRILKNLIYYFYNFEAAKKLDEFLDHQEIDIAHVHLIFGGLTPSILLVLKKRGIPVVYTAHDYRLVCPAYTFRDGSGNTCERCRGGAFYHCFFRRCTKQSMAKSLIMASEMYFRNIFLSPFRLFSGFIFVSHFSQNKHMEHAPVLKTKKMLQLYNFNQKAPQSQLPELQPDDKKDYYLFFGRLSAEKGVHLLLKVFAEHPELNLKIVGTGPLEEQFREEIEKKELRNIVMLGYKTGIELKQLIANARFVFVPSECYENNPMTIIESFQFGIPVISSNIGGIPELMDHEANGFLFEPGSQDGLSAALKRAQQLSQSEYDLMKTNCRAFYEKNFTAEQSISRLISFYQDLITENNPQKNQGVK